MTEEMLKRSVFLIVFSTIFFRTCHSKNVTKEIVILNEDAKNQSIYKIGENNIENNLLRTDRSTLANLENNKINLINADESAITASPSEAAKVKEAAIGVVANRRNSSRRIVRRRRIRQSGSEGEVRLVGGKTPNEGNIEVFHLDRWGTICDDEFDEREGRVVCRHLGYSGLVRVTENSQYGIARRRIWMDNIYCTGDEKRITECRFEGWGNHDCTIQESAGVECYDPKYTTTIPPTTTPEPAVAMARTMPKVKIRFVMGVPMHVRLVGGRVREEGRVEVRFGDEPWGVVCGDGWGMLEAAVVCRMLGLGYAQAPVQSSFFGGQDLNMILSGVECMGSEMSIADCLHDRIGLVACPGRTENIAGVICTEIAPDLVPDHHELERSSYLEDRQLFFLQCAMEENCMARTAYRHDRTVYGWQLEARRLLRFTAKITNIGTSDFRPFIPKEMWQWHMCHMHYHSMEVFAHFDVIDANGLKVAEGHKASFCLEDNECAPNVQAKYACANYGDQGITVGCTDTYLHTVDCQWIDITDIAPGLYFFKVSINPEFKISEMRFDNNAAICNMYYNAIQVHIWNCTLTRP